MTTELTKAAQQALEALEDARDDVETARQQAAQLIGYPRTDARHASYVAQLEKHDAAIDALRNALTQRPAAQTEREGWTDADADAARLALELECLLLDTKDTASLSRWWASANDALDLHRARLAAPQQATPGRHLTVTTNSQGEAVMVSWQDDDHRILEVVWERKQATPEPLIVKGAMAGMVDAQVRDLWPTKGATPEPVGELTVYVSAKQFESAANGVLPGMGAEDYKTGEFGAYLPVRHVPGGKFTQPVSVYTRPAAAPAPAVPEGFALVPVEPTPELLDAFQAGFAKQIKRRKSFAPAHKMSAEEAGLRAMLAAAQAKGADHG